MIAGCGAMSWSAPCSNACSSSSEGPPDAPGSVGCGASSGSLIASSGSPSAEIGSTGCTGGGCWRGWLIRIRHDRWGNWIVLGQVLPLVQALALEPELALVLVLVLALLLG